MAALSDWNKNGLTVFLEMEIIAGDSPSSGGTAQWIVAGSPGGWGSSPVGSLEDGSAAFSFGESMRRIMYGSSSWRLNATDGVGWNTITQEGRPFEEASVYAVVGEGASIVTHSQVLAGNIASAGGGWVNFNGPIRDVLAGISAGDRFAFGIASGTPVTPTPSITASAILDGGLAGTITASASLGAAPLLSASAILDGGLAGTITASASLGPIPPLSASAILDGGLSGSITATAILADPPYSASLKSIDDVAFTRYEAFSRKLPGLKSYSIGIEPLSSISDASAPLSSVEVGISGIGDADDKIGPVAVDRNFAGDGTVDHPLSLAIFNDPTDGQVVSWDATDGLAWIDASAGGSSIIADGSVTEPKLAVSTDPTDNQVLSWNGSAMVWVDPATGGSGDDAYNWATVGNDSISIPEAKIPSSIARDSEIPDVASFITETDVKAFARTGERNVESGDITSLDATKLTGNIHSNRIVNGSIHEVKLAIHNNPLNGQVLSWDTTNGMAWKDDAIGTSTSTGGLTVVSTNETISGDGTGASPLGIADDSISSIKLVVGAVTNSKITNNTIAEDKLLVSNHPTDGKILSWDATDGMTWKDDDGLTSVATDPALTGNGTVGDELGIASGGIDAMHISNAAVTNEKIDSVDASKLTGTIADARIPASIARDSEIPDVSNFIESSDVKIFARTGGRNVESDDITSLVASKLTGIIADARIPASIARDSELPDVSSFITSSDLPDVSGFLSQTQVDARVDAGVEDWAEAGNSEAIPAGKLTNAPGGGDGASSFAQLTGTIAVAQIPDGLITEPKLSISNTPSDGEVLSWDTTNGLTWDAAGTTSSSTQTTSLYDRDVGFVDTVAGDSTTRHQAGTMWRLKSSDDSDISIASADLWALFSIDGSSQWYRMLLGDLRNLTDSDDNAAIENTGSNRNALKFPMGPDTQLGFSVADIYFGITSDDKLTIGISSAGEHRSVHLRMHVIEAAGDGGDNTDTIADEAVTEPKLDVINSPTDGHILSFDTSENKFRWVGTFGVEDGSIGEGKLDIHNDPSDGDSMTWNDVLGQFEWQKINSADVAWRQGNGSPLASELSQTITLPAATGTTVWGQSGPVLGQMDAELVDGGGDAFVRFIRFSVSDGDWASIADRSGHSAIRFRLASTEDGDAGEAGPDLIEAFETGGTFAITYEGTTYSWVLGTDIGGDAATDSIDPTTPDSNDPYTWLFLSSAAHDRGRALLDAFGGTPPAGVELTLSAAEIDAAAFVHAAGLTTLYRDVVSGDLWKHDGSDDDAWARIYEAEGTIADARIPSSIARDSELPDVSNFIESSDVKIFARTGGRNVESGDITSLVASKLTGTISEARIPSTIARDSEIPDVSNFIASSDVKIFARTGGRNVESGDITSLVASKLTGTIANARIPSSIARDSELPTSFGDLSGEIQTSDIANEAVTEVKIGSGSNSTGNRLVADGSGNAVFRQTIFTTYSPTTAYVAGDEVVLTMAQYDAIATKVSGVKYLIRDEA